MDKNELWQALLAQIQFNISKANFATWFKNTEILDIKEGQVIISVPNNFSKEWLENKYNKLIFQILHNLNEEIKEVKYQIVPPGVKNFSPLNSANQTSQLEFQALMVDQKTNLNPRYTFDNFIVGPFNELAQAAGWAVVQNPGLVYNPLFIYGGVGLGKTHLLQAIGNEIVKKFPSKKTKYIPSEKFVSGIVNSIKNHNVEKFKSLHKDVDVLIIDDVQFFAGKEKTQEEFFHIFNTLYEQNKQIILSSDRLPKAIPSLEERLKSRFEGGMIADISLPDFETRIAILKAKSQEKGVNLSDDVLEYVASNIRRNIRELEGALNRLVVYQRTNNQLPNLETAKTLLKNIISSSTKVTNLKNILTTVALFYNLTEKDLLNPSRKKEFVKPRQIAIYLLREELKNSFPFIGKIFGGKDHTTIIHAYNKIKKEIENNESLVEEINLIKDQIYH